MRREYLSLAVRKLRRGEHAALLRQALRIPLFHVGKRIGRPLTGPFQAVLVVTYRCNLLCQHCDLPLYAQSMKGRREELTTDAFRAVIDDYAALGAPALGFAGGEPFVRKDLLDLVRHAKGLGMTTHVATNGMLWTPEDLKAMMTGSLDGCSVSIDGARAETHDEVRARPGAFAETLAALRAFLDARRAAGGGPLLNVNCAIGQANYREMPDLVERLLEVGVDGVGFIPMQESGISFRNAGRFDALKVRDTDGVERVLERLVAMRKHGVAIDNSVGYLRTIRAFFRGEPLPVACTAGYHTCVVDCYGDVFPCIPYSNRRRPVGNIGDKPLRALWTSDAYSRMREETSGCRDCFWNCHTELTLALG
jgi:MoaA/NifB/PqqE/SkfB family radical SAM enzyme